MVSSSARRPPSATPAVKVSDGVKECPTLEVDPVAAPIVKEVFESSRRGNGLREICKELNGRGITNRGRRWQKNIVHYLLTNEAYTGTAVWGVKSKDEKAGEPVRVENAWPALVSRELFDAVQQGLHQRAPTVQRPARVGGQYLLSGLLRCGVCGKPYSAQGAKSGQFAYYVCASLFREGAGACSNGRYLNAAKMEDLVIEKVSGKSHLSQPRTCELVLPAYGMCNFAHRWPPRRCPPRSGSAGTVLPVLRRSGLCPSSPLPMPCRRVAGGSHGLLPLSPTGSPRSGRHQ